MAEPARSRTSRTQIVIADDLAAVARSGADLFVRRAAAAVASHGRFDAVLSGGSTPRALHALLANPPYCDQVAWEQVQFYWGDERCVPPDAAESNYRMARETLLSLVPVADSQIYRIRGELLPDEAAAQYEHELRATLNLAAGQLPRFDLLFLGMGPDGHTLSLFPHTAALAVRDRLVTANYVPKLDAQRVTLTYPTANNAAAAAFLVAGADKADALAAVLEGPRDPDTYPAQGITLTDGDLYWLVDRAAAAKLRNTGAAAS